MGQSFRPEVQPGGVLSVEAGAVREAGGEDGAGACAGGAE
jgi:hypothetical protein